MLHEPPQYSNDTHARLSDATHTIWNTTKICIPSWQLKRGQWTKRSDTVAAHACLA